MTTPKLYELTNEYRVLLDVLETNGENPEAFAAAIDDLKGQIEDKAEGIVHVYKELEISSNAIDAEIERLKAKKQTAKDSQDFLRGYLKHHLESLGINNIKRPLFSVRVQDNLPAVEVVDIKAVPAKYKEVKLTLTWEEVIQYGLTELVEEISVEPTPKKRAILDDYKATGELAEGTIIKKGTHLRIA